MCYVNGHKFHIVEWGRGKKKKEEEDNSGVCVKGNASEGENDLYGVLIEILELKHINEPLKGLCYSNIQHI